MQPLSVNDRKVVRAHRWAWLSLVLSTVGLFILGPFAPLFAILCGCRSRSLAKKAGIYSDMRAVAGICIGCVGLFSVALLVMAGLSAEFFLRIDRNRLMRSVEVVQNEANPVETPVKRTHPSVDEMVVTEEPALAVPESVMTSIERIDADMAPPPSQGLPVFDFYVNEAEHGDIAAMNEVACMYRDGRNVDRNDEESLWWFLRAANAGNPDAMYNLGILLEQKKTREGDIQSLVWLQKAAEVGHPGAMMQLSRRCLSGRCGTNGVLQAVKWLQMAADKDHVAAMEHLGALYRTGHADGLDASVEKALIWLHKAEACGSDYAVSEIGRLYERGDGVEQNFDEAFDRYEDSWSRGYVHSGFYLGHMYEEGLGTPKDDVAAYKLYWAASEWGDADAQAAVARFLFYGIAVQRNYPQAFFWAKKASQSDRWDACYLLGVMYAHGLGVRQNLQESMRWFEQSMQQGGFGEGEIAQIRAGSYPARMYPVTFQYTAPTASSVYVLTDYNGDSYGFMEKDGDGNWSRTDFYPEGTYAYRFRVNGMTDMLDPENSEIIVIDGQTNSLLRLPVQRNTTSQPAEVSMDAPAVESNAPAGNLPMFGRIPVVFSNDWKMGRALFQPLETRNRIDNRSLR